MKISAEKVVAAFDEELYKQIAQDISGFPLRPVGFGITVIEFIERRKQDGIIVNEKTARQQLNNLVKDGKYKRERMHGDGKSTPWVYYDASLDVSEILKGV